MHQPYYWIVKDRESANVRLNFPPFRSIKLDADIPPAICGYGDIVINLPTLSPRKKVSEMKETVLGNFQEKTRTHTRPESVEKN